MTDKTIAAVVTEEDLMKSLSALAGKPATPDTVIAPKMEVVKLAKSFAQTVKEIGTVEMQKALDVSDVLTEFVGIVGKHVDLSLETLAKSLAGAAERDMGMIEVLTSLKKSIDDNTAAVVAFGKLPGSPASVARVSVTATELLAKSVPGESAIATNPAAIRNMVLDGLTELSKSCPPGSNDQTRYQTALIKFESSGVIADDMLNAARRQVMAGRAAHAA